MFTSYLRANLINYQINRIYLGDIFLISHCFQLFFNTIYLVWYA